MTELNKFKDIFLSEAEDNLERMDSALLRLEKQSDKATLEEIMRVSHTLKSSSAAMGYLKLSSFMHDLEDIFSAAIKGTFSLGPEMIDDLFRFKDKLKESVRSIRDKGIEADLAEEESKLKALLYGSVTGGGKNAAEPEAGPAEKILYVKVPVKRLDALMNLIEGMLVQRMRLETIVKDIRSKEISAVNEQFKLLFSDMQYQIIQARLVPVGQIFARFPRAVRDLAKAQNKKVDLEMIGEDIELDRSIVDKLAEPLSHLIRNAVDHGIEKEGKLRLVAVREKDRAIVSVEDNGKGIDWNEVIEAAEARGLAGGQKIADLRNDLSEGKYGELKKILLGRGVSTKGEVTETSGRGVGLSIVRIFAEETGGRVRIESPLNGGGSRFTIEMPLTLAIIEALIVSAGGESFAIPFSIIDRSLFIPYSNIKRAADQDVAVIGDEDIPLIYAAREFHLPQKEAINARSKGVLAVVVKNGPGRAGIVVEEIIDEQEIAARPMPTICRISRGFSGFSVLGDGRPVLIVDPADLIEDSIRPTDKEHILTTR